MQIGSDGTVGRGKIWKDKDGKTKEKQTFISPEGSSFETGHIVWVENNLQHTQSYNIVDGTWEKRRYYVWKQGEDQIENKYQEVYQPLSFLIGEWASNFVVKYNETHF